MRTIGGWILSRSPNVHTLVVVAIYIALATALLATALADPATKIACREFLSTFVLLASAVFYLPVVAESDHLARDAAAQQSADVSFESALQQVLTGKRWAAKKVMAFERALFSALGFLVAVVIMLVSR